MYRLNASVIIRAKVKDNVKTWLLMNMHFANVQLHQLEELLGMNIVQMGLNTLQTASLTGGLGMNTCKWVHHPRARCEHFTNNLTSSWPGSRYEHFQTAPLA